MQKAAPYARTMEKEQDWVTAAHSRQPMHDAVVTQARILPTAPKRQDEPRRSHAPLVPSWIAINTAISGVSFNDMELYVVNERESVYANRALLAQTCPSLLKKIEVDPDRLLLDDGSADSEQQIARQRPASMPPVALSPQQSVFEDTSFPAGSGEDGRAEGALHWLKSAAGTHSKRASHKPDKVADVRLKRRQSMFKREDRAETVAPPPPPPPAPPLPSHDVADPPSYRPSTMPRIRVYGCSAQSLRALLFYLFTHEFHFLDLHMRPATTASPQRHRAQTSSSLPAWANTPPAFDVKAAYSLSTDLHLLPLQHAAQHHILTHLLPQSVLVHYLSPFAQRHTSIRRGMMAFIEQNWHDVRNRPETQQALARLAHGDFPEGHRALFKLLCRMDVSRNAPPPASAAPSIR